MCQRPRCLGRLQGKGSLIIRPLYGTSRQQKNMLCTRLACQALGGQLSSITSSDEDRLIHQVSPSTMYSSIHPLFIQHPSIHISTTHQRPLYPPAGHGGGQGSLVDRGLPTESQIWVEVRSRRFSLSSYLLML